MADANVNKVSMTEKQKVKEITDRLEEGLKELFEGEKYKSYLNTMSKSIITAQTISSLSRCSARKRRMLPDIRHGRRILSAM